MDDDEALADLICLAGRTVEHSKRLEEELSRLNAPVGEKCPMPRSIVVAFSPFE